MQLGLEIAQMQCICLACQKSNPEFNFQKTACTPPPQGWRRVEEESKQAIKQEKVNKMQRKTKHTL